MLIKISEIIGPALDWAVAQSEERNGHYGRIGGW